jgi:hypothetical protein
LVYDETHVDRRIAKAIVLNRHLGRMPERGLVRGEMLEDVHDLERRELACVNAKKRISGHLRREIPGACDSAPREPSAAVGERCGADSQFGQEWVDRLGGSRQVQRQTSNVSDACGVHRR